MGYVIAIIVAVIASAIAAGLFVGIRRRRSAVDTTGPTPLPPSTPTPHRPEPTPMHGLEDALAKATDRSGRSMAERLDDENELVEGLRVTDDTGPLLRRALDHVRPDDESERPPETPPSEG